MADHLSLVAPAAQSGADRHSDCGGEVMRNYRTTKSREKVERDDEIASVDYKAATHEVLEAVDRLLAEESLEIVMVETGGDDYSFTIEVRQ